MKFDTIIIGGGLTGMTAGIALAEKGQRCAIISSGLSSLQFFSGSFELLGYTKEEEEIKEPLNNLNTLPNHHPYSLIGKEGMKRYTNQVKDLFARMGINVKGSADNNHYRITPLGELKPAWLTLDEFAIIEDLDEMPWKKVALINITGFLDFHTKFIADGLEKLGITCKVSSCTIPELEKLRESPTEMRSANIAKELDKPNVLAKFAQALAKFKEDVDIIILPSVFGMNDSTAIQQLTELLDFPIQVLPALPPSVGGIRTQLTMQRYFNKLGGYYLLGDTVTGGVITNGHLNAISTLNQGDILLEADNFILATGGILNQGLTSTPTSIFEPIFGLDVKSESDRSKWFDKNLFSSQPYMEFGINVNEKFQGLIDGQKIENLYVTGSALGGVNTLKESSGGGISLLSALNVADIIFNKKVK